MRVGEGKEVTLSNGDKYKIETDTILRDYALMYKGRDGVIKEDSLVIPDTVELYDEDGGRWRDFLVTALDMWLRYESRAVRLPCNLHKMDDAFSFQNPKRLKSIVIPASCVSMKSAFVACDSLVSVTFEEPASVTCIYDAFAFCKSLKSIEIPPSVKTIGAGAFMHCYSLNSINIPLTVDTIGSEAFSTCQALRSLELHSGLVVDDVAFKKCTSLASVVAHGPVEIGMRTFGDCVSLVSVDMPVAIIPASAFSDCISLPSFNFDKVTKIDDYAFSGCSSLQSVDIPSSVTSLGYGAFRDCTSLQSAKISATQIDSYVFSGCKSLTTLELGENVSRVDGNAFAGSGIREVICHGPTLNDFDKAFENPWDIVLYVPADYLEAYKAEYCIWFKDILPIEGSSSVGGVVSRCCESTAVKRVDAKGGVVIDRYNALGQRVR